MFYGRVVRKVEGKVRTLCFRRKAKISGKAIKRGASLFSHLHTEDRGGVPCMESLERSGEAHKELHGVSSCGCLVLFSGLKVINIAKLVALKS